VEDERVPHVTRDPKYFGREIARLQIFWFARPPLSYGKTDVRVRHMGPQIFRTRDRGTPNILGREDSRVIDSRAREWNSPSKAIPESVQRGRVARNDGCLKTPPTTPRQPQTARRNDTTSTTQIECPSPGAICPPPHPSGSDAGTGLSRLPAEKRSNHGYIYIRPSFRRQSPITALRSAHPRGGSTPRAARSISDEMRRRRKRNRAVAPRGGAVGRIGTGPVRATDSKDGWS